MLLPSADAVLSTRDLGVIVDSACRTFPSGHIPPDIPPRTIPLDNSPPHLGHPFFNDEGQNVLRRVKGGIVQGECPDPLTAC